MKFVIAVAAILVLINLASAHQLLNKGYFLYDNISVGDNSQIVVGVNSTANIDLFVIPSSSFNSFINGGKYTVFYNQSVGTGIYQVTIPQGNYTVIFEALRSTVLDGGSVAVPLGQGSQFMLDGKSSYNLTLSNYSRVYVTLLAAGEYSSIPVHVTVLGSTITENGDTNIDTLNLTENAGNNRITLQSSQPITMFMYVNATPTLVNPLFDVSPTENYSVGVASYGLYNISSKLFPYQVRTNEVIGIANISSMNAYSPNPPANSSVNGASLQLNVVLNTHVGGVKKVLWLQDVLDFNTSSGQYYLVDNIWNDTGPSASISSSDLQGSGNLTYCDSCGGQAFYAASYPDFFFNYTFPFSPELVVIENQTSAGTEVSFGYQVLQNGTSGISPLVFFDHVTIPGAENSTLLTTPFYQTPGDPQSSGNYYDSELVFAGESGGSNTQFSSLSSTMWIYYKANGTFVPFPSVYTFGLNTAESASNIKSVPGDSGAYVSTGKVNLAENLLSANALSSFGGQLTNNTRYTVPTTTVTLPPAQLGGQPISKGEKDAFYIIGAVAIIFILVIGYLLVKKN